MQFRLVNRPDPFNLPSLLVKFCVPAAGKEGERNRDTQLCGGSWRRNKGFSTASLSRSHSFTGYVILHHPLPSLLFYSIRYISQNCYPFSFLGTPFPSLCLLVAYVVRVYIPTIRRAHFWFLSIFYFVKGFVVILRASVLGHSKDFWSSWRLSLGVGNWELILKCN